MIEARKLTKQYGAATAVKAVSFTVAPGEVVGLLGPNGAGKTTLLRMLAGVLTPSDGEAVVAGSSTLTDPFGVKRQLGFLSGDTALSQRLSPREVLTFFGELHGLPRETLRRRISALVAGFEMEPFADRPCGTLSAGQKQRANLARAFLHEPPALILDEPTTALDVLSGRFLLEAIRSARAEGRAILFSTHVLGEAEYLCDRVVLLHQGQVLDQGPIPEVCARAGVRTLTEAFLHHLPSRTA
ncbi:heme ABC exporter ATP-binding protein CcmA [Pyxidicoccus sp. 3LG]